MRPFQVFGSKSSRWQNRLAILFGNTEDDIATVQILVVVCERANGFQDLASRGFFVPACLELHTGRFHGALVQKVIEVDGKDGTH